MQVRKNKKRKMPQAQKVESMKLAGPGLSKTINTAAGLVGAGVGITTALNQTALKISPGANLYPNKVAFLISRMVGPQIAGMIMAPAFKTTPEALAATLPAQGTNPAGIWNDATFGGAVLLLVNYGITRVIGGKYGYHYISPLIKGIGGGLLGGGIIGGLFDPVSPIQAGGPTSNPGTIDGRGFSSTVMTSGVWGSN